MERRGMAYRVAPYAPPQAKAKADVYVQWSFMTLKRKWLAPILIVSIA
jgi:hypothetical protein